MKTSESKNSNGARARNVELAFMRLLLAILRTAVPVLLLAAVSVQADDRRRDRGHRESHNYIIERQQAGMVSGPPTIRRIRGSREIDGYRDHRSGTTVWFERNNVVGVTR